MIGRNNVFTYKGKMVQLQQVAAELGVKFLLEVSVRRPASASASQGSSSTVRTAATSGPIATTVT